MSTHEVVARMDELVGHFSGRVGTFVTSRFTRFVTDVRGLFDLESYKAIIARYEEDLRQREQARRRESA